MAMSMEEKDFPGALVKRGDVYHYQVHLPGKKYVWKKSTGKETLADAVVEARKLYMQAVLLNASPEGLLTFSAAAVNEVKWVGEVRNEMRATRVGQCLGNFLSWAGDVPLAEITRQKLTEYQAYRAKCGKMINKKNKKGEWFRVPAKGGTTIKAGTIKVEINYIRRMLKRNGFSVDIPEVPAARVAQQEYVGRPLRKKELEAFFHACKHLYPKLTPGTYLPIFTFLLCTGARPGEVIPSDRSTHKPLLKEEIDYEEGAVTLRSCKLHEEYSRPKTTTMAVMPEVLALVKKVAEKNPGPYVFPAMDLHTIFSRILKAAGMDAVNILGEKVTAHSFRHTFGTILANRGINTFVIQNLMRHSDPKTTAIYTRKADEGSVINPMELIPSLNL